MKRALAAAVLSAVAASLLTVGSLAPAEAHGPTGSHRGDLLSSVVLGHLDATEVSHRLERGEFSSAEVRTGVTAYRIDYRTVDGRGRPTFASGLVVLPDGTSEPLRLVLHAHGTTTAQDEVASTFRDPYESGPALTFASAGFAAASPDYLGLGDGPGQQRWFDVPSEVTAELDMLSATRELAAREGRTLRRGVDVTGFSQGASAALGLARALDRQPRSGSALHALAPVSGAYAFRSVSLPAVLAGRVEPMDGVVYVALLLTSWNRFHHLYDDPRELFRAPYAGRIERLMDDRTPPGRMIRGLPGSVDDLLTPAGRHLLAHPTGAFARALAVADSVCDWRPEAPTRLYYAEHDEQAVRGNTRSCAAAFARRGVRVPVRNLGPVDALGSRHLGSNVAGALAATRWFLRLG